MASSKTDSKRSRGRARRAGITALAAAGCVGVAATAAIASSGSSAAQKQLSQYTKTPTSIGSYTALPKAPPKGKTLVYLGTTEVSNVQVGDAFKAMAAKAHWNFFLASYDPANPASFTAAFNIAIAKHANYVAEAGTVLPPAIISAATAHHIKITLGSVYPESVTGPVIDSSDGYAQDSLMGELVADEVAINSKGSGKVVEEAVPAYPILDSFKDGFQSKLKVVCPKCKIAVADVSIPQLAAGQLGSVVASAVKTHPGYTYLVTDDGPFFDGITSTLSAQGISGEKILGEAGDETGFSDLKSGTNLMWTGYSVPGTAWEEFDAMVRNSEGLKVPKIDATQPTQVATKANANSIVLNPSLGGWSYPTNGLQQFYKIWKLG